MQIIIERVHQTTPLPVQYRELTRFEFDADRLAEVAPYCTEDARIARVLYPKVQALGYVPRFWSLGAAANEIKIVVM
jgi:hypothetical protein